MKRLIPAVLVLFVFSTFAQDLMVNVTLTMLDVAVEDEDGHSVMNLKADDFEVVLETET